MIVSGPRRLVAVLFAVFLVHVLAAVLSRNGLVRDDAESYVLLGRNLSEGAGYVFERGGHPTSWRAPGYPVFLAGIFWTSNALGLGAQQLLLARLAHAALWVLTAYCVYRLALHSVGERDGLVAAGTAGFYPCFIGFTGLMWSESLFTCLFMGAVLAVSALGERKPVWYWLGTGVLLGAAVLTRSTAIVLLPAVALLAWLRKKERSFEAAAIITVAAVLVVGAWSARNHAVHGRFILVESNAGFNLYAGNRPTTPIPFAWRSLDTVHLDPEYQRLTAGTSEGEAHAALTAAGKQHMLARPLRTAVLAVTKTIDFWLPDFFVARNVNSGALGAAYRRYWIPILPLTALSFLVVTVAAARHMLTRLSAWYVRFSAAIIALYTLPHAIVFGVSRHHLPLMPLIIVLAAPELRKAYETLTARLCRSNVNRQG